MLTRNGVKAVVLIAIRNRRSADLRYSSFQTGKEGDDLAVAREIFTGMGSIEFAKLNVEVAVTYSLDDPLKDYDGIPWRRHLSVDARRAGKMKMRTGFRRLPFPIANTK